LIIHLLQVRILFFIIYLINIFKFYLFIYCLNLLVLFKQQLNDFFNIKKSGMSSQKKNKKKTKKKKKKINLFYF